MPGQDAVTTAVAKEVARALQLFSRAARARHLYRSNNAALHRVMGDLSSAFSELLGRAGEISLRVRPDAFLFDDQRVYEETNPQDSIAFTFFRDGLRRIDLSRGLTDVELSALVDAAASSFNASGMGDDVVSTLWRHDLSHVHYVVVDTAIVDYAPTANTTTNAIDIDAQVDGLLAAIYGASREDVSPRSLHVDGTDLTAKPIADRLDRSEDAAPGFHPLRAIEAPPACASAVRLEIESEHEDTLRLRLLYAALETFVTQDERGSVSRALLDLFDAALSSGDLNEAARIVASVRGLATIEDARARVEDWVAEAVAEPRLRPVAIAATATRGPAAIGPLLELITSCGPSVVSVVLALVPSIQDPHHRRAIVDATLDLGIDDLHGVRALLTSDQAFVASEAVYILASIGTDDALDLLTQAKDHPQPQVRAALLEQSTAFSPSDELAIALALLPDSDEKVAAIAARKLARIGGDLASIAIERSAKSADQPSFGFDLKLAILEAYATLHGSKALPLLAKYLQKAESRSANETAEDLAIAAAHALRIVSTSGAAMALKAAAGYWNKRVRDEARAVMQKMRESLL